jgi:hypothetical protein
MADGSPTPIATRAELFEMLAPFNVSPETPSPKERVLYGPGIRIELGEDDPVMQFLMYEVDTDISIRVLVRIAKAFDWILTDLDTLTSRHLYRGAEDDEG